MHPSGLYEDAPHRGNQPQGNPAGTSKGTEEIFERRARRSAAFIPTLLLEAQAAVGRSLIMKHLAM